jgi:hypothetical protein
VLLPVALVACVVLVFGGMILAVHDRRPLDGALRAFAGPLLVWLLSRFETLGASTSREQA